MSNYSTPGASRNRGRPNLTVDKPDLPYEFLRCMKNHKNDDGTGLGTLRVREGAGMSVLMNQGLEGKMKLTQGWVEIMEHYRIQEENKLMFSYDGGRHFELTMFGPPDEIRAYYSTEPCGCYQLAANEEVQQEHEMSAHGGNADDQAIHNFFDRLHDVHLEDMAAFDPEPADVGYKGTFIMKCAPITRTGYSLKIDLRAHQYLEKFGVRSWEIRLDNAS